MKSPAKVPLCVLALLMAVWVIGCSESGNIPAAPTPSPAPTPVPTPAPAPAPAPTPVEPAVLQILELNPPNIGSQSFSIGTVTLTGPSPEGGALVSLASTNRSVATVPSSMLIPAGEKSGTFRIESTTVGSLTSLAIVATYGGVSNGATLTVGPQPLRAVLTPLRGVCLLSSAGELTVFGGNPCFFDARKSTGNIVQFRWSIRTARATYEWTSVDGFSSPPLADCPFFAGLGTIDDPDGFSLEVGVRVVGKDGELSEISTYTQGVSARGVCGYP